MGLKLFATRNRKVRAMVPNGPSAEVLIGVDDDWQIGVASVSIPPGGGMPEHDHSSSAATLIPIDGTVQLISTSDGTSLEVEPGAVATIPIGERVEVKNEGRTEVLVMVVFDPPHFTRQLASWPPDEG